jgi:hypothetical protein
MKKQNKPKSTWRSWRLGGCLQPLSLGGLDCQDENND